MTRIYFKRHQTFDEHEDGRIDRGIGLCFSPEMCGWYYVDQHPHRLGPSVGPFPTREAAILGSDPPAGSVIQ